MTQSANMDDLIERIEKLEGPDREVDCAIGVVTGLFREDVSDGKGRCWVRILDDGSESWPGYGGAQLVPAFTASLDAAMSLVPDEHIAGVLYHAAKRIQETGFPKSTYLQRLICEVLIAALQARNNQ